MLSLTKSIGLQTKQSPLLNAANSIYSSKRGQINQSQSMRKKMQLMDWFKNRPELNSPVMARVNDTIKDVEFLAPNGQPLGRNKRKQAESFWKDNYMDERLKSIWAEAIVTGEAFGWKGKLTKKQINSTVSKTVDSMQGFLDIDLKEMKQIMLTKAMDEESKTTRVFDYVASSTVEVLHDERNITSYKQQTRSATGPEMFSKEEIIHFKFIDIDGNVNGYTPVEGLATELILIWFIKENMMAYMRNNGTPKKIFTLKEEIANSPNHEYVRQQLETFGALENRHGNLVLAGNVDVQDLEKDIKDMDYKELALYATSNVAYSLQMPVSRIPYMIGKAQSGGDSGGLADAGYWSMLESDRMKIENLMNSQMFEEMGFIIRFKKSRKIDDLRETQAMSMKADAITKLQTILGTTGQKLTNSKILNLMEMRIDDVEAMSEEEKAMADPKSGLMNQNLMNNQELMRGEQKAKKAERSKTAAVNNPKGMAQDGTGQ